MTGTTARPAAQVTPPRPTRRRWWLFVVAVAAVAVAGGVGWRWRTGRPAPDPTLLQLDQARTELVAGHFPAAREHLTAVLEMWPLDAEAHFLMARACRRDDDLDRWDDHLRAAAKLQWPADDIDLEQRFTQIQTGDVRRYDWLPVTADPAGEEAVLGLEALAKGHLTSFRLDELLACTTDWISRRPADWQPHYLRGQGYSYGRLMGQAADAYRATLDRYPNHPTARLRLATVLMVDGLYDPARTAFVEFLATNPRHPDALVGLANCEHNLGQTSEARAALDQLFAVAPDYPAGCYLRSQIDAPSDPAAALEWLQRAERQAPRETDITHALVQTLTQLGRRDEAARYQARLDGLRSDLLRLDEVRKSVRRNPDQRGPRFEAGELCARLGRTGEATNWFRSVLVIAPNDQPARQALVELAKPPSAGTGAK